MNEAEARSMVRTAEESGKNLGAAYYRRMYPKVQRAKQLLAAGAIGQPVLAELTCHEWRAEDRGHRSWLLDPALAGGGPLFDIASHRIDVLNFLFGQPERATGYLSNVVHHYAVEDNATAMIDYASGVRGIVDVRWHSKIRRDECRIRGTEGEMELSPLNGPELVYPGGRENLPVHANVHSPLIENFVDALLGQAPLLSNGATAFWTDWITERARAAQRGLRDPRLLTVVVANHFSALHHKLHPLERGHVLQRIAIDCHDVGPRPRLKATHFPRPTQQVGSIHRG